MNDKVRIFVSIASYRDPECQHTVRDLFEKAAYPHRVSVGVCWQFDPIEDADCFEVPAPFPAQVRFIEMHASESRGCWWAREQANNLMQGEEYLLQIDAYMRFAPGWDKAMIDALQSCPGEKNILSGSPPAYWPPDRLESVAPHQRRLITVHELGGEGDPQLVHMGHILWDRKHLPTGLMRGAFIVGNFVFMPAQAARDIPYDPYIYFRGQEPVYSARFYTHGWDIWQPEHTLIWHFWGSKSRASGTGADYKLYNERAKLGRARVEHLLMGKPAPAEALQELDRYGMGKERSIEDFWRFAGVDLPNRKIHTFANKGRWDGGVTS